MKNYVVLSVVLFLFACQNKANKKTSVTAKSTQNTTNMSKVTKIEKTEEEWKQILTPEQFHILREKGTDRPSNGGYTMHFQDGKYSCTACGLDLFTSESKFESHCGWPSFDSQIDNENIVTKKDSTLGMIRTEILCGRCGGHLGHVFDDGPTQTGLRYCVNSTSIKFDSKADSTKK